MTCCANADYTVFPFSDQLFELFYLSDNDLITIINSYSCFSKCNCNYMNHRNAGMYKHGYIPYLLAEERPSVPSQAALGPCCSSDLGSFVLSFQALSPPIPQTTHSEPWSAKSCRTCLQSDVMVKGRVCHKCSHS